MCIGAFGSCMLSLKLLRAVLCVLKLFQKLMYYIRLVHSVICPLAFMLSPYEQTI